MPFPAIRAAATLIGATVAGALLASGAAVLLGHGEQVSPIVAAAAVCLVAALTALEPIRRASKVALDRTTIAALAGIGIRLAMSLLGGAILVLGLGFELRPTVLWTLAFYLLLLFAEAHVLVRYFQSMQPHPQTAAAEGR